jgi:P-loop ATPase protein family
VTVVVIGGTTEERVEDAVRTFEAEGFRRARAITEDFKGRNIVVPLRVGAADVLKRADHTGISYVLVHHGPDDRIKNGTYARAHHRVEAPQLIELARRLGANQKMLITCVAFAFRVGIPKDSTLVVDARCLDNPYWKDDLRDLDGRDPRIAQFVLDQREASVLLESLDTMLGTLLPAYRARGRMELTIAFGCNGGRQRSVALAIELARRLMARMDLDVGVELRDLEERETS